MKEDERIRELEKKVNELAEIIKIMARASAEWGDAIGKNLLKVNMQLLLIQMEMALKKEDETGV